MCVCTNVCNFEIKEVTGKTQLAMAKRVLKLLELLYMCRNCMMHDLYYLLVPLQKMESFAYK